MLLQEDLADKGENVSYYLCARPYMYYLLYSSHRGSEVHIIFSMLHPRKGELREVRTLAQGHTPDKQQSVGWGTPGRCSPYNKSFYVFVAHRKEHQGPWGLHRKAPPCLAVAQGFRD